MAISRLSTRWRRLTGFRRVARRWSRASKSPRGASRGSFDGHEAWTSDEAWAAANQSPSMMSALTSSAWRPRKQPRKEPRKQPRKEPRKRENGNIFQRWNYFDSERFCPFRIFYFFNILSGCEIRTHNLNMVVPTHNLPSYPLRQPYLGISETAQIEPSVTSFVP